MAQGEMLVGTRPSGYAIRSRNGGPNYTTRDGGFATEADAKQAGENLAAIVGTEFDVVPNVIVVVQGRRGRKPKAEANGQPTESAPVTGEQTESKARERKAATAS